MNTAQNTNNIENLTNIVTWSVLLGKWTSFAKSALALPDDEDGDRWKATVAPMIGLQALCFALGECGSLSVDERLLGIDRAGLGIRNHSKELDAIWRSEPMPADLLELLDDAGLALVRAEHIGFGAIVQQDGFVMPDIHEPCLDAIDRGFDGELFAAAPGTILAPGEPAIFSRPRAVPFEVPGLERGPSASLQEQVYRSIDDSRGVVSDEIVAFHTQLPAGRPMLEHAIARGKLVRPQQSAEQTERWIEQQARAFDGRTHEVVRTEDETTDGA